MEETKVYVEVMARFTTDGTMIPVAFKWEDGKQYRIDSVREKGRYTNKKIGLPGVMYTVLVAGKVCHLYYELEKWFMERK